MRHFVVNSVRAPKPQTLTVVPHPMTVMQAVEKLLDIQNKHSIMPYGWRILLYLYKVSLDKPYAEGYKTIAWETNMSMPRASEEVRVLEVEGLVKVSRKEKGFRSHVIELTEKARELYYGLTK